MSAKNNKHKEENSQRNKNLLDATVLVAIIGLIGTIVVTFINLPPIIKRLDAFLNPTPTLTSLDTEAFTPFVSETPIITSTLTPTQLLIETNTPTITESIAPTEDIKTELMMAQLTFSASTGRVPFTVNFSARGSFVDVISGDDLLCNFSNVCSYSWSVRLGGSNVYGPTLGDVTFSYTFNKKGDYLVVVYVCRGDTCNFAAASITAK